jgi:5'(3')-deoxyribonucleotidase
MDEEKLIILVQGHTWLYNLQHNDYDNRLVKDNYWKEIAGALDKELS